MKIRSLGLLPIVVSILLQGPKSDVIARVGAIAISKVEVEISEENAKEICQRLGSVGNESKDCSTSSIERIRLKMEQSNLAEAISKVVFDGLVIDLKLEVEESEIQAEWMKILSTFDADRVAMEYAALYPALSQVFENKLTAGEAYDTYVAHLMPKEKWETFLDAYTSNASYREMIRIVAQAPYEEISELNSSEKENIRLELLRRKLEHRIDRTLAEVDPRFTEALSLQENNTLNPSEVRRYLDNARKRWWAERYSEADIKILDPRYSEVSEYFSSKPDEPNMITQ